jgi:hypothetical protein
VDDHRRAGDVDSGNRMRHSLSSSDRLPHLLCRILQKESLPLPQEHGPGHHDSLRHLRCVEENNNISQEITRFVLPLGATVNMDGTAIYYPIAVIFVANIQGMYLSFGEQITVAIVSAFVSIGAAPIPSAGLVYLILIMAAVNVPITDSISFVMSVDWLLDRFQTCCNIVSSSG